MKDYRKSFWTQIEIASMAIMGRTPTEDNPVVFGNVAFWVDAGEWCYSSPVSKWNVEAISQDIASGVERWVKHA